MLQHRKAFFLGLASAMLLGSASPVHAQRCVAQGDGTTWGDCSSGGGRGGGSVGGGGGGALSGGLSALVDVLSHPGPVMDPTTQAALDAYKRGDYATALPYARALLARNPNDYVGLLIYHTILGIQATNAHNYAQTIAHMRIVIAQMRSHGDSAPGPRGLLLSSQAHIAASKGNWTEAAQLFDEALKVSPTRTIDKANYEYALASVAIQHRDFSQARAHLGRVLEIWPNFQAAKENLAKLSTFETSGRINATSSAYEQAKQAKGHGAAASASAQGVTGKFTSNPDEAAEKAKHQASIPFDSPGTQQGGGDGGVHFQKSPTVSRDMYRMGGTFTKPMMEKLERAPGGHQLVEDEYTWRDKLQESNNRIAGIKSKLSTARGDQKEQLMDMWTKELNAQPEINRRLNEIEKKAREVVTETVHE